MKKISLCLSVLIVCIAGSACDRHSKEEVAPLTEEYAEAFPKVHAAKEPATGSKPETPHAQPAGQSGSGH